MCAAIAMTDDNQQFEPLQPTETPAVSGDAAEERLPERQYCVFRAGRERFCLSVLDVEEVVEWPTVTRVPLSPAFLMGVFNLRGSIVPLIDIAFTEGRRADLPPKHVVVAEMKGSNEGETIRLGIAADEVIGTYTTPTRCWWMKLRATCRTAVACCDTRTVWR